MKTPPGPKRWEQQENMIIQEKFETKHPKMATSQYSPGAYDSSRGPSSSRQPRSRATEETVSHVMGRIDIPVCCIFSLILILLLSLGFYFNSLDILPDNLIKLGLNESIALEAVEGGEPEFFDIRIPGRTSVAIFIGDSLISGDAIFEVFIDTSLTILKRPNDIIAFNDDVALGNANPILYVFLDQDEPEDFVIRVDVIAEVGNYSLIVEEIIQEVVPDKVIEHFLPANEFFLAHLVGLVPGQPYDVIAYLNPALLDPYLEDDYYYEFSEADTAIRIRELDGTEIVEVFQSTLSEFTARLIFTPVTSGPYILEIKGFDNNDNDIFILARSIDTEKIDIANVSNNREFGVHSQIATVLEFDVVQGNSYDITLTLALNDSFVEDFKKDFGYVYYNNSYGFLTTYNIAPTPGISLRLFDKDRNEIFLRGRTDIEPLERSYIYEYEENPDYVYQFINFTAEPDATKIFIEADENRRVLLDISRWDPHINFYDVDSILENSIFGTFTIEVEISEFDLSTLEKENVDPNNLFPDCDIDDTKYTLDDNSCEQGIVLYCRDQFAPSNDLELANLDDFSDVCDCTNFLCATLQSGNNLDGTFRNILRFFAILFAILSIVGVLTYILAHLELFICGGFEYWVRNNEGFSTWTFILLFFLTTAVFFISQVTLASEIDTMKDISAAFDAGTIPIPSDLFNYRYYYSLRENITGYGLYDGNRYDDDFEGNFLTNQSAEIAADARSFRELQILINLNLFCSVLKDVLAIVVFLDVSTGWISATAPKKLNPVQAEREQKNYRMGIRATEGFYLLILLGLLFGLVATSGDNYNVAPNVFTLLASLLVMVIYSSTRRRVGKRFAESQLLTEQENSELWVYIRNVSSIVIVANAGVILVQLYSIAAVKNFDELIDASDDAISQMLFLFQDICLFTGIVTIMIYVIKQYFDFRDSLFSEEENFESTVNTEHADTANMKTTKKVRTQIPNSSYYGK